MSTWQDCLDDIVLNIQGLNLTGVQDDQIKVRKHPRNKTQWFPGITVHPVSTGHDEGTNEREDIGYGCQVTMIQRSGGVNVKDSIDKIILWDVAIRQQFINTTLSGVSTVWQCTIEEAGKFDERASSKDYDVLALIVRCWVREA